MGHKVTGPAAVVKVGGTERYLYRGHSLPSDVPADEVRRLVSLGLVSQVKDQPKTEEPDQGSQVKDQTKK